MQAAVQVIRHAVMRAAIQPVVQAVISPES